MNSHYPQYFLGVVLTFWDSRSNGPAAVEAVRRVQQQVQLWESVQPKSPKNESLTTDRDRDKGIYVQ